MRAFKVVNDKLRSSRYGGVQYKLGQWVTSDDTISSRKLPNSRLFVFKTLEAARSFSRSYFNPSDRIFECEIKGGVEWQACNNIRTIPKFWEFFNSVLKRKKKITKVKPPKGINLTDLKGVLLTKAVKLIREVT